MSWYRSEGNNPAAKRNSRLAEGDLRVGIEDCQLIGLSGRELKDAIIDVVRQRFPDLKLS